MNQTIWTKGTEITLTEVLDARENRAHIQQKLLEKKPASVLSFTLNIAGPKKVFPLTKQLYEIGCSIIRKGVLLLDGRILNFEEVKEPTGYEGFFALSLSPESIKKYLTEQEETHPLGRLFDFDVLRPDGTKVSRQELGFSGRTCLLCDRPAFLCGRSRTHSAAELLQREITMMNDFYDERLSVHIGLLMQKALFYEVNTTLKPGLVDRTHNGSHKDMSIGTFVTSAYALTPYFIRCARLGLTFCQDLSKLPELFKHIRKEGQTAELTMLRATGGVNTHKGIVFSGGILCAAAGYAVSEYMTVLSCENLPSLFMDICQNMLTELMNDYRNINENTAKSHGERLYAEYGVTGIRGEASYGFPHLFTSGLPVFENALKKNYSMNQAGQLALLYYIANTEDTNLITRSDYLTAQKIRTELAVFLQNADEARQLKIIPELDAYFVSKNISPGGSADMLALTYFLHFLQTIGCVFD